MMLRKAASVTLASGANTKKGRGSVSQNPFIKNRSTVSSYAWKMPFRTNLIPRYRTSRHSSTLIKDTILEVAWVKICADGHTHRIVQRRGDLACAPHVVADVGRKGAGRQIMDDGKLH